MKESSKVLEKMAAACVNKWINFRKLLLSLLLLFLVIKFMQFIYIYIPN